MSLNTIPLGHDPIQPNSALVMAQARGLLETWMSLGPTRVLNGLTLGELAERVTEIEQIEARMDALAAEISWCLWSQKIDGSDAAA